MSKQVRNTHYASRFTHHVSRFTFHVSRFTFHTLRPTLYVLLLLLLAILAGWLFWPRDDGVLAEVQRRGTLRVGLDASFPPFESIGPDGQIAGLDVDIARAIAADLGVQVEPVNIGFDGLYDALLARRVDLVISSLPYDPRRTGDVAYTTPYFNAGQVLVTRAGGPAVTGLKELAGQVLAVEWGSPGDMLGRQLVQTMAETGGAAVGPALLRRPTAADALAAVLSGEAEAAVVDAPSALGAPGDLRIVTYVSDELYVAAVHLKSRRLLAEVNRSLARLGQSGQMAALQARWFGEP